MAFINTNAVKRGDESIDTKFSALVEPNLFPDEIFQPNLTFTDKYMTDAMGQLFVRKLGKGNVDTTNSLTFNHEQTEDELISIVLDKPFKQSEAIYEEVSIARQSGTGVQKFETLVSNVREAWQQEAMDQLVAGATASAETTATDIDTLKDTLTEVRKELRDNYAKPDTLIVSNRIYALMLQFSGKEFTPAQNEETLRTGRAGTWFGLNVYENPQLTDEGTSGDTEFVMYEKDAYSILSQLITSRIVDAGKDWAGSAAQFYVKSGFKVTTADRVYKKTIA